MRTCQNCKAEMTASNVKKHIRDPDSYGCDMKYVVVGRWHVCPDCGTEEYEEIRTGN